jgi:hypothetical protein
MDPTTHSFDPSRVLAIANANVVSGRDNRTIADSIDRALIAEYGMWVAGWRWAANEPGGGGPMRTWCCAGHSLFAKGESAGNSVSRVVDSVTEWRAFLDQLSILFAELRKSKASIEHAASRLLPIVVERTDAQDAWYSTYAIILRWYLESAGVHGRNIEVAIHETISGQFSSWIAPDEQVASDTSIAIATAVDNAMHTPHDVQDGLSDWLNRREGPVHHIDTNIVRFPVFADAHRRWIDSFDEKRDATRAKRMRAALKVCRVSAMRGQTLSFKRLSSWQSIVLGVKRPEFRTTDAFAKGGRERYSIQGDTKARFEAALEDANSQKEPAVVRAARVYLDVCFFHPFADGNARAARLAMDHVLTRAGLALYHIEPVIVVARAADDPLGTWNLAHVINHLAGERGRSRGSFAATFTAVLKTLGSRRS